MAWTKTKRVAISDEKRARVASGIFRFAGRRYYPTKEEGFEALVDAVCDIVWDKPEGHRWDMPAEKRIELRVEEMGNDLDWLMKHAFERFRNCPSPREFRAVYCQYGLVPIDGGMINEEVDE